MKMAAELRRQMKNSMGEDHLVGSPCIDNEEECAYDPPEFIIPKEKNQIGGCSSGHSAHAYLRGDP